MRARSPERMIIHFRPLREDIIAAVGASAMIAEVVAIFVLAILAAAFTGPLQTQITSWQAALTSANQTAAATVVGLIPLMFWLLLAVAVILSVVHEFIGKEGV